MTRESLLAETMVELADTLVDDFDIVDLLTTLVVGCVDVLDVDAAGIMVADPGQRLRPIAASSEQMRLLELFELQTDEGPSLDCYATGEPVLHSDLADIDGRWPRFAPAALASGFAAGDALPMRHRGTTIGALNLFHVTRGEMRPADVRAAQAMADVATIAILQQRASVDAQRLNEQLQTALNSRIVIEQAKGVIAERSGVDMTEAFDRLRSHARANNLRLAVLAQRVVDGTIHANTLS